VRVQGEYNNGSEGFSSVDVPVNQNFWPWSIDATFLTEMGQSAMNVSLYLTYEDPVNGANVVTRDVGPVVSIVPAPLTSASGSVSSSKALVIALPIVIGLCVLALATACVWSWRRHGRVPLLGGLGRRASQGYGVRQSKAERVRSGSGFSIKTDKVAPTVDIQLTDRDSWSPTSPSQAKMDEGNLVGQGRNVFREELRRQEREG
jgi:hypothetical protein